MEYSNQSNQSSSQESSSNQSRDKPISSDQSEQVEMDARLAERLAQELARQEEVRNHECNSDAALAMMLQRQFDSDYNEELRRREERLNGHSKVGVSLDRFRRSASANFSSDFEHLNDNDSYAGDNFNANNEPNPDSTWDVFEQSAKKQRSRMMGRSGFVVDEDGNMITKHDIPTSSRKNMCRLMELKTDIETGDAAKSKDDFKITNYVYNRLKVHSKKKSRRATQRFFDTKERENSGHLGDIQSCMFSEATRSIMDGLLVAYKIEKLNGVIGHGKESTVLHATGRDHEDNPGQEVAVKIFKSDSTMAFKTRDSYNKSKCPSYKFDKPKSKHDSLNKWAESGFKNLKLLRKANIDCPDAISLKKHVLVMTFLGSDALPSPQLKYANLDEVQLRESYNQVIDIMKRMYTECGLIHGDLSEYNLLWHNNRTYVIDVSQSMFTSHPNANSFLFRDCKNILNFYKKSSLSDIVDEKTLFELISGKSLDSKSVELWSKLEEFPRNEKLMIRAEANDRKNGVKIDDFPQMLSSTRKLSSGH